MHIDITDDDTRISYELEVELYRDDAGRYVEPNCVTLKSGFVRIGIDACFFQPDTTMEGRRAGAILADKFSDEIDAEVRRKIAESREPVEA